MPQFVIIDGPQISEIFNLVDNGVDRIGSAVEDSIQLDVDSIGPSEAEVFRVGEQFQIRSTHSDGRLMVNGLTLEGTQALRHGDIVILDRVTLLYNEFDGDASASASSTNEPESEMGEDSGVHPTIKSRQSYYESPEKMMESLCKTSDPGKYLGSLLKATNALVSNLNLTDLMDTLLDIIFEVIPADRGTVLTAEPKVRKLRPVVSKSSEGEVLYGKVASRTIIREVLATKEGVLTQDAMQDDRFSLGQSIVSQNIHAAMCVPLISKSGEIDGIIYIDKTTTGRGFVRDHLRLLTGIAMEATLAIENARLVSEVGEKKRLEQELETASTIQMGLIPTTSPSVPGIEVAGVMISAKEVGGDYYDFVLSEDQSELYVVIGDVSGKGVPACLVMVMARSFFRPLLRFVSSTLMIVDELNRLLYADTRKNMFMTMLVLCYDVARQTISWTGAGHEHLLVYRAASGEVERIQAGGVPLGMKLDCTAYFKQHTLQLDPGDTLLLYTDGVTEAVNEDGQMFSLDETAALLARHGKLSAEELVQYLLGDLRRFSGSAEQHDDITLVALKKS